MPIAINNEQNINRVYTKMSEDFSLKNNAKLNCGSYFEEIVDNSEQNDRIQTPSYDHMYASNNVDNTNSEHNKNDNCQNTDDETGFLKEWIVLHLHLIEQQSNDLCEKDKIIELLKEEIKECKEHLRLLQEDGQQQDQELETTIKQETVEEEFVQDDLIMTHDSKPLEEDTKDIELYEDHFSKEEDLKITELLDQRFRENNIPRNTEEAESIPELKSEELILKQEEIQNDEDFNSSGYSFSIDTCNSEFDPMRNLRMSIRRKRLSNSSTFSNNDSVSEESKLNYRNVKKKRRIPKEAQYLTTGEQYITQAGEATLGISIDPDEELLHKSTNLEVPRWRVRHFASCYAMEGTENTDDEAYNRRHSRLEIDERRRKRWDVQRIREQRVIEKLKQRQERVGSGSRIEEQSDAMLSLWPKIEDIKFLEVGDDLPVSAFGCPLPKVPSSEFSLPWLNNPTLLSKRIGKKATGRRKSLKR